MNVLQIFGLLNKEIDSNPEYTVPYLFLVVNLSFIKKINSTGILWCGFIYSRINRVIFFILH